MAADDGSDQGSHDLAFDGCRSDWRRIIGLGMIEGAIRVVVSSSLGGVRVNPAEKDRKPKRTSGFTSAVGLPSR
jgi:hypothetical protein